MTSADKTKLNGIATGANNYSHPTQTAIDANATDNGISVIDRVVVNTLGHVTSVSTRNLSEATTSAAGVMSSADKTKLNGIAAGAQVNVGTNLGSSGTGGTRTITSSTGSSTSITYTAANVGAPTTTGSGASGTWSISITGNAATSSTFSTGWTNYKTVTDGSVAGLMMWKNYGNNHVIFDASNSTTPSGTSCNNTNSQIAWTGTYPTLMGWNGSNTYGVRVDSARVSDNTSGNSATTSQRTFSGDLIGSGSVRGPIFYDTDNTDFYINPASTSNINELSGNGKNVLRTYDSYLRINESSSFSSGCWFGGTLVRGDGFYAGSNGGTSTSRVHIASGSYNGSRVIFLNGADGTISAVGNITASDFIATSDARIKFERQPITDALSKVCKMRGETFIKSGEVRRSAGYIAQDLEAVLPEGVYQSPEGVKQVSNSATIGLLIEAVKELQKEVAQLKSQLEKK